LRYLSLWNGKFRDSTIQADHEFGKYPHDALINILESGPMNSDFLKSDAGAELIAAVEAIVKGEPFLSGGLAQSQFQRSSGRTIPEGRGFAYREADD
jgi:hypothetical protein